MSFEEQIRERAYHIWLAGGMADGQAHEHWVSAEQAMHGETAAKTAEPEAMPAKAKAKPGKVTVTKIAAAKPAKAAAAKAPRTRKAKPAELTAH